MRPTLEQVTCASLPLAALPVLADLRHAPGIRGVVLDARAGVHWPDGDAEVLHRVLPVRGVRLYARCGGFWHQLGRHLPELPPPAGMDGEGVPLSRALVPAR